MGVLEELQKVNAIRSAEAFHMPVETTEAWRFGFGISGEAAEVCQDMRKIQEGREVSKEKLGDELADVVTYAELIASKFGIDLCEAIVRKYNKVSEAKNHPSRL